jgi:flagellar M-ring protein FliF
MATGTQLQKSAQAMPGQPQLTDRLAGLWGRTRVFWAQMHPAQRGWTVVLILLLGGLVGGLFWYGLRPDWHILYASMDTDDVRSVGQVLAQAQIPFKPTTDGAGIMVPAAQLDKARLVTAAKGMKSGRLGFELFDKPNWVGSEFDEQVNYQRALEGELEHTVGTLSDIQSARVHLVLPHDSLFRDAERPAKASVVLRLRHRTLADGEPEAIRNLVSSAVDGLTPEHVVLVDAAGHIPLGPKTADALRLSAEQALEEKLITTLEPVTGAGNVRASVTLDYDSVASEETKESYDPDQTVTLSMQRTEQASRFAAGSRRHSRSGFECAQRAGPAGLPDADRGAADRQERSQHLRGNEDHAACDREPGEGAAADCGHRGKRPDGPDRHQGQGGGVAGSLARGVAQPDGSGAGRGGLRLGARRPAGSRRYGLRG